MIYSRITGVGSHLPQRVMENAELEKIVDTSDEWITSRTGIARRHIAADGETTCDLAEPAARRALTAASRDAGEIDLIVVATTTPDLVFPSTACLLQRRLGASGPAAFDVQAVCTGFIYALSIADKFIKTGASKKALIVGAETMSRIVDWNDRSTCVLFGDGAGAVVLEAADAPGVHNTFLHADGNYQGLLQVPSGVGGAGGKCNNQAFIEMQGNEVFKMAVNTMARVAEETLRESGVQKEQLTWLLPHQANVRIIEAVAKKLSIPMQKIVLTVAEHGNTSAASIPLALDTALKDGLIRHGDKLLMVAFGGGFTWGSALLDY